MGETAGDEGGTEPNLIAVVLLMDEQQRTMSVLLTAASILCFPLCYGGGAALCACSVLPQKAQGPSRFWMAARARLPKKDLTLPSTGTGGRDGALCASSLRNAPGSLGKQPRDVAADGRSAKRLNAAFAHDLRTPLTVLRGYAGMLLHDLPRRDPAEMAQEVAV